MATRAPSPREPRTPLSRDRVLRAAIALADETGIEGVTMRRLAQELGAEAMSLYYHVARKDDILDGIADIVVGEIELPRADEDWKAALRRSAISAHDVLLRHPWACSLMMSPKRVRPARLRHMESILGTLRRAGFSAEMTHLAYHALDSHVLGFSLWAAGYAADQVELADFGPKFIRQLSPEEYPYLLEHVEQHMSESTNADVSEFEFGLDLILDGLERLLDPRPA
jgi:AcrR family transcriptional regulator